MTTVRQLLESKGYEVWLVAPEMSAFAAIELMAERGVGALMVCEERRLIGIFTERDYLRRLAIPSRDPHTTPVGEVMTERVLYVRPDQHVGECMALMTEKHIRHLPVLEDQHVIGMVSIRDVIADVISEREFMITQLENYITNSWA